MLPAIDAPDHSVLAAMIAALATVTAALIGALAARVRRVEHKIDGLRNGSREKAIMAIEALQRDRELRRLRGLPVRRLSDQIIEDASDGLH